MSATPVTHIFSRINPKGMWGKLTVLQAVRSTMMLLVKLTQMYFIGYYDNSQQLSV